MLVVSWCTFLRSSRTACEHLLEGHAMSEHPTTNASTTNDDQSVADDVLDGAIEIGRETGKKPHQVYRDWKLGRLVGCWKSGGKLRGSKSAIRRDHRNRARSGK